MALRHRNLRARLRGPLRELGPYAAIVLIVPGGSLIALALSAFRHRTWLAARARQTLSAVLALAAGLLVPH